MLSGASGLDVGMVGMYVFTVFVDCLPAPSISQLYSLPAPFAVFACSMWFGMWPVVILTLLASWAPQCGCCLLGWQVGRGWGW
ncbi:hypothetical protein PAXRUDRAFT_167826 [Paxillus rubicundulus Ve08.2h10]|uniref:Uncharacterized protein n=1 Tax=Paxillus rubicundulus Ve08.2h10 TaxID=930991 RepID=A0A0D0CP80_9AGAM|nr:hypothetical protein PAXRUDRAFT_167826 [Paxillus rubicundulus Ve08.2h10]